MTTCQQENRLQCQSRYFELKKPKCGFVNANDGLWNQSTERLVYRGQISARLKVGFKVMARLMTVIVLVSHRRSSADVQSGHHLMGLLMDHETMHGHVLSVVDQGFSKMLI
ncbi:hypothetical protein HAX54_045430 [Datura stramonium]|uniref:Uncharacterized protein n=1 Tax=Datura stramonium TaxID=4076 RepID=A0ABS8WHS7_DATST|nr:hypothetical protein [Datura stramonium]